MYTLSKHASINQAAPMMLSCHMKRIMARPWGAWEKVLRKAASTWALGRNCCGARMQVLLACCGVLVRAMGRAEADAALQGPLMPALVKAFQHNSADVRKAVRPLCTFFAASCSAEDFTGLVKLSCAIAEIIHPMHKPLVNRGGCMMDDSLLFETAV